MISSAERKWRVVYPDPGMRLLNFQASSVERNHRFRELLLDVIEHALHQALACTFKLRQKYQGCSGGTIK